MEGRNSFLSEFVSRKNEGEWEYRFLVNREEISLLIDLDLNMTRVCWLHWCLKSGIHRWHVCQHIGRLYQGKVYQKSAASWAAQLLIFSCLPCEWVYPIRVTSLNRPAKLPHRFCWAAGSDELKQASSSSLVDHPRFTINTYQPHVNSMFNRRCTLFKQALALYSNGVSYGQY